MVVVKILRSVFVLSHFFLIPPSSSRWLKIGVDFSFRDYFVSDTLFCSFFLFLEVCLRAQLATSFIVTHTPQYSGAVQRARRQVLQTN